MNKTKVLTTFLLIGALLMPIASNASFWSWLGVDKESKETQLDGGYNEHDGHDHHLPVAQRQVGTASDYNDWLAKHPHYASQIKAYEQYLHKQLGTEVPPMYELLTTARSWQDCGYEPYEVPPQELWDNMLPTLRLYSILKWRGILPSTTQIRSVYRNPELNRCAGGATSSKHMVNAAIDIWVPEYGDGSPQLYDLKDKLCTFWKNEGQSYNFGLGLYATGAIHFDTQGYRKWGLQFSSANSPCREILEKLHTDGQF